MTTLSTHVLDATLGVPAAGIEVSLDGGDVVLTDDDGRVRFDATIEAGPHDLVFATGPWFADRSRDTFFPAVHVAFSVEAAREHLHLALLLSPYAYTTYQGS